jgi:hypothetical protein
MDYDPRPGYRSCGCSSCLEAADKHTERLRIHDLIEAALDEVDDRGLIDATWADLLFLAGDITPTQYLGYPKGG